MGKAADMQRFKLATKSKQKSRFILMCAGCGRVRWRGKKWIRIPDALSAKRNLDISHSLCPACFSAHYPDLC